MIKVAYDLNVKSKDTHGYIVNEYKDTILQIAANRAEEETSILLLMLILVYFAVRGLNDVKIIFPFSEDNRKLNFKKQASFYIDHQIHDFSFHPLWSNELAIVADGSWIGLWNGENPKTYDSTC